MNIDIKNIGHYRVISHGGRLFDLFNRETDKVINITRQEWDGILEHMSIAACDFVMRTPR